ncbi:hypothetical protein QSK_2279 [Clostridioides difficile P29]|nr:hypothetical protein QSK_2279 [Clostridioides difficile P29]
MKKYLKQKNMGAYENISVIYIKNTFIYELYSSKYKKS